MAEETVYLVAARKQTKMLEGANDKTYPCKSDFLSDLALPIRLHLLISTSFPKYHWNDTFHGVDYSLGQSPHDTISFQWLDPLVNSLYTWASWKKLHIQTTKIKSETGDGQRPLGTNVRQMVLSKTGQEFNLLMAHWSTVKLSHCLEFSQVLPGETKITNQTWREME